MDDKNIELLRSNEEINLELEDKADAWKRLSERLSHIKERYFVQSSIKTDWLNKKMR